MTQNKIPKHNQESQGRSKTPDKDISKELSATFNSSGSDTHNKIPQEIEEEDIDFGDKHEVDVYSIGYNKGYDKGFKAGQTQEREKVLFDFLRWMRWMKGINKSFWKEQIDFQIEQINKELKTGSKDGKED